MFSGGWPTNATPHHRVGHCLDMQLTQSIVSFFYKKPLLHPIRHFLTPVVSALVKCTPEVIQAVMLIDVLSFALPKHGGGLVTVSVWSATKGVISQNANTARIGFTNTTTP